MDALDMPLPRREVFTREQEIRIHPEHKKFVARVAVNLSPQIKAEGTLKANAKVVASDSSAKAIQVNAWSSEDMMSGILLWAVSSNRRDSVYEPARCDLEAELLDELLCLPSSDQRRRTLQQRYKRRRIGLVLRTIWSLLTGDIIHRVEKVYSRTADWLIR